MPVFECIKSEHLPVLLGTTIVAKRDVEAGYITLLRDSDAVDVYDKPLWKAGDVLPINGFFWSWKEVK